MWLALTLACETIEDSEAELRTSLAVTAVDALPPRAPGVVLLATLGADGSIAVGGTVQSELWVDLDEPGDGRYAFRYVIRDADRQALYQRSTSGPVIVRDFLAYYSEQTGYSLLELFPLLGTFTVTVPVLEQGASVEFQIRREDGEYEKVGEYDLSGAIADDHGVSEAVVATETLHAGGPPDNSLDIVIVPDGYQEGELSTFAEDAAVVSTALLGMSPLADYSDAVNVYRVDVPSLESGASYDCEGECEMRDTAFDSFFPLELVNRAIGSHYRTIAVFQLDQWEVARAASAVPWDLVLVIVNTGHDGGFAVHYATVSRGLSDLGTTAAHELSHVLGQLGDEYDSDDCIRSDSLGLPANIAEDPENPPWSHWIDEQTPLPTPDKSEYNDVVGAFEEAYNCDDLYRPERACLMRSSSSIPQLCAVCEELVTRRIFRYSDPAVAANAAEMAGGGYRFTVDGAREETTVRWRLDDLVIGEGATFELQPADVPLGPHALVGEVVLGSEFVIEDEGDLGMSWTWAIE